MIEKSSSSLSDEEALTKEFEAHTLKYYTDKTSITEDEYNNIKNEFEANHELVKKIK